jgi:hypothetical protein
MESTTSSMLTPTYPGIRPDDDRGGMNAACAVATDTRAQPRGRLRTPASITFTDLGIEAVRAPAPPAQPDSGGAPRGAVEAPFDLLRRRSCDVH